MVKGKTTYHSISKVFPQVQVDLYKISKYQYLYVIISQGIVIEVYKTFNYGTMYSVTVIVQLGKYHYFLLFILCVMFSFQYPDGLI